jgi:WhiB family redox-sensing transcriptional regulator
MDRAACRDAHPSIWFPESFDVPTREYAKGVCRACPVRLDCLRHALEGHERHGIWGGINMANRFACYGLTPSLPDEVLEAAIQGHNPLNPRRFGQQRKGVHGPQLTAEEEAEIPRMVLRLVEGIERRCRAS